MNGKSGNLNNCCRQIYPEGCTIPANEVICIMDADQVSACGSLITLKSGVVSIAHVVRRHNEHPCHEPVSLRAAWRCLRTGFVVAPGSRTDPPPCLICSLMLAQPTGQHAENSVATGCSGLTNSGFSHHYRVRELHLLCQNRWRTRRSS